ncbi:MipA/OmpV family protein [Jeongeupia chitinilytica]|uniref:Structural protein MipA n=1 Tax=Jeongeupia chitinilytica TaxID=1041641 RepID=A0ABQ3GXS0_9NEIS|nr:MipA/OmpV family protein [Jeongeupia chitinilytica]GHD56459.1 structural protein MipA [Jeongeupia chitinilytica]
MRTALQRTTLLLLSGLATAPALADPRIDAITTGVGDWFTESEYTLGAGVAYGPKFAGSKDYQFGPYFNIHMLTPQGIYFDPLQGVGWQTQLGERFVLAIGVGYDFGRSESDKDLGAGSDRLKGMGDVKGSVLGTTSLGFMITPVTMLTVSAEQALSNRDRGLSWSVQLGHAFELSETDTIGLAGSVQLGDSKYNQTYFGVTQAQSKTSRFKAYEAGAGINSYTATINWTHKWTKNWNTDLSAGVTRFAGEVENSPLLDTKTNYSALLTLNYTF